jgi:hypothetical protein
MPESEKLLGYEGFELPFCKKTMDWDNSVQKVIIGHQLVLKKL